MPSDAHEKIVRLDITMYETFAMQKLQTANHLVDEHQYGFDGEMTIAKIEQIFQRWTEQVHDQYVIVFLLAIVADAWYADATNHNFVQFVFVQ